MEITFTTPRGAVITIAANEEVGCQASVNGKLHTEYGVKFVAADAAVGPHVTLEGVKAQVPADQVAAVSAFFRAVSEAQNDLARKTYSVESRMRDMHSRYSVN